MTDTEFRKAFRDLRIRCGLSLEKAGAYFTPPKSKQSLFSFESCWLDTIREDKEQYESFYKFMEKVQEHREKAPTF